MKANKYGFEASVRFGASIAESKEKQAVDVMANDDVPLWRISAVASRPAQQLIGRLLYGTGSSMHLANIVCPLVAYVPGNAALYLQPSQSPFLPAELIGHVTLKAVQSPGQQVLRTLHDASGGVEQLAATAVAFTAYAASTLTVAGIAAIPLAAGETLKLIGPATLTAGSGIAEHEL